MFLATRKRPLIGSFRNDISGRFHQTHDLLEPEFHTSEELNARDGIVVVQLVLLAGHVVEQRKSSDLVVHLIIGTEAKVKNVV